MTATDTQPGIRTGVPELTYHSDRKTLSASGAKTLLKDPERFIWERDHGRPPKAAFDLGGVVHALVLRSGDERIRIIDAYDWRTKAAQDARKAAWAAGLTPINRTEFLQATKIAGAVRRHPLASTIFTNGKVEASLYWTDPVTGVACRARVDWPRDDMVVALQTARSGTGTADTFGRQAASFNYPLPAAVDSEAVEVMTGKTLPFITVTGENERGRAEISNFIVPNGTPVHHPIPDAHRFKHARKLHAVRHPHARHSLRQRGNARMHPGSDKKVALTDPVSYTHLTLPTTDLG